MPLHRGIIASGVSGTAPGPPTSLSASSGVSTQSVLTWIAPVNNGGGAISDYLVQYSTDNSTWTTFSDAVSATTGATVTGLSNGTLYYFRVAAINTYGTSTYASTTATPYTVPSAPATATLSAGTGATTTDTFTWIAPSTNGSAITTYGYQVSTDNGSSWGTEVVSNVLTYGINTAYTTGRYSLRVRANNAAGWGSYSANSAQTVAWSPNPGTATDYDYVCGPAGCSTSETVTEDVNGPCGGSCYEGQYCTCGAQYRYRTRSKSRSGTRTSSRSRTAPTNYYSRSGNNNSATTTGTYGDYGAYTYGAWSYGAYSDWSYSAFGGWSACDSTGTWEMVDPFGGNQDNFLGDGVNWDSAYAFLGCYGFVPSNNVTCAGGSGVNLWNLYVCNRTGARKAENQNNCCYPSCC